MLKKILIFLIFLVFSGIVFLSYILFADFSRNEEAAEIPKKINLSGYDYEFDYINEEYEVYQNENLIAVFDNYKDAYDLCIATKNSVVRKKGRQDNIYENIYEFIVKGNDSQAEYSNIAEAFSNADNINGEVYDIIKNKTIYKNTPLKGSHNISGVPLIGQYPELYRGCEITSLCMLLNYNGIQKTKTELAQEIFKDTTAYTEQNGMKIYADPNIGFVGDIYSKDKKGYGVYHKPIYNLLENYCHENALDITGITPEQLYYYIENNNPVWVIVNSKFEPLPSSSFEKWHTSQGEILITYSEHSVLVTGYDNNFVYFNDPMRPDTVKKAERQNFEQAWIQMGSQAVTVIS